MKRNMTLRLILMTALTLCGCKGSGSDNEVIDDSSEEVIDDAKDEADEENNDTDEENTDGTLLIEASFEGTMLPFKNEHDGADIYTDPTAPDGSRVLRFTYPPGHPSGYSTDLAWVWFEKGYYEVKAEYYFKYSDNFYFHPVANKQVYLDVGDQTNFVLSAVDATHTGGVGITTEFQIGCQYGNIGMTELKNPNMASIAIRSNIWYKVTL